MPSRIASALIQLPGTNATIADVLWRNADINATQMPLAVPSARVITELVQLTSGDVSTAIIAKLPSPAALDIVMKSSPTSAAYAGVAINPVATREQLSAVILHGGDAAGKAQARLDSDGADVLAGKVFDLAVLEKLAAEGVLTTWCVNLLAEGSSTVTETFRRLIVASPQLADMVLLTAVDGGTILDVIMLERLLNPVSVTSDTARQLLDNRISKSRDLTRVMTPAALRLASIANIVPTTQVRTASTGTDYSMATTLRAAGMSSAEIAPLLLGNDSTTLPEGFLNETLLECSNGLIAQFLGGASARRPRDGEALALLRALGADRSRVLAEMISDSTESVSWAPELLVGFPVRNLDKLGLGSLHALRALLIDQIGEETATWEFMTVMSEEWEQTLDSLLEASSQMSVLK